MDTNKHRICLMSKGLYIDFIPFEKLRNLYVKRILICKENR